MWLRFGLNTLVPRPSGASAGDSLLPAEKEGSSQTAPFPPLPPEPPCASADCVSYLQRSAHYAGFSAAVARQLTNCRRRSTQVNYQAKWAVYRAWCHHHGHSVSRPTVSKVADFLLYLRRSLSPSYSSTASYRSMLIGVFRFVLPEISTHFVLHDLLRSFRLERPLSSSQVPPWDLLRVLHFLRGPPFEPLASYSLWDLTQQVLFLVSLATARRMGELQAVSRDVSFSGSDVFLIFRNFVRRLSLQSIRCLAPFVPGLWRILSAIFRRSSCSVLFVLCGIIPLILLLFLLVLVQSLCLLTLLLVLCLKTLLASFFGMSFPVLPLPLLLGSLPLLLLCPLRLFVPIVFVVSRLHRRLLVMLHFLLCLQQLLGLLLLSLPISISLMFNFLPLMVLVWVLWWRQVPWFRCF